MITLGVAVRQYVEKLIDREERLAEIDGRISQGLADAKEYVTTTACHECGGTIASPAHYRVCVEPYQ